ncbi:MAG: SAM-dependent methyltransferase [Zetaproteobacteria bacterium]|nr:MAG: SAM-dependent methyltransferase [Zetaproteobacteria bacterium]
MEAALYEPELGYYERRDPFAEEGDYVTAADLGDWAALAFADLIAWGWRAMGAPSDWALIEQGGGSGRLLCAIVTALEERGASPPRRIAIERTNAMRRRQQARYRERGISVAQYDRPEAVPPQECAILISNELPDAFPVRSFVQERGRLYERLVAWEEGRFRWRRAETPLRDPPPIDPRLRAAWPEGYRSEWNPHLACWMEQSARLAERALLFCVDYGFAREEYYRPERRRGTLMGHANHRVVERVLDHAGGCDITAHVDFTALAEAARAAGFRPLAFTPQWAWLAQSPVLQARLARLAARRDAAAVAEIARLKRLIMPQGMGETFKLFVASRGGDLPPPDHLAPFDRLDRLGPPDS